MISSKLVPILAAIDIALLGVILVSAGFSAGRTQETYTAVNETGQEMTSAVLPSEESESNRSQETAEESLSIPATLETQKETEAPLQTVTETAAPYEPLMSPAVPVSTEKESAGASAAPFFDVTPFDTREKARLEDFNWVTSEIVAGKCPPEGEDMVFIEALGGWKCYIWDAAGTERLANMDFSGTEEALTLRFDWNYIHLGSEDQGYDDSTPDSVYHGSLKGNVEATGAGKVVLTDFYRIDDHQYAFGTIMWPDGISGHLMLVRP